MTETHTDRRVRKSKQALQDAILGLIPQKGYDTITIQDIADAADTARVTLMLVLTIICYRPATCSS